MLLHSFIRIVICSGPQVPDLSSLRFLAALVLGPSKGVGLNENQILSINSHKVCTTIVTVYHTGRSSLYMERDMSELVFTFVLVACRIPSCNMNTSQWV